MSSKKEEKGAAAERIKAATMSATKGLSRAQAERAAAAATRNVNAYGQKEEGPSRWQERKELKRKMYLLSTEKAVTISVRKEKVDTTSTCQKCYQVGHWTADCKNERVYLSRPTRSQLLKNPKLRQKMMSTYSEDFPDTKVEEEEEKRDNEEKQEKKSKKKHRSGKSKRKHRSGSSKRKHRSDTESSSDSEASESDSDSSGSDSSDESASSYSSSSDSEEDRRRSKRSSHRKKQKSRRKRYSSSSESSDYDSSSDSDSDSDSGSHSRKSRRKSRKRSHR